MAYLILKWADTVGHKLHLPWFLLRPICDRYDLALGVPDTPENFPERHR